MILAYQIYCTYAPKIMLSIIEALRKGDRRSVARAITRVDNDPEGSRDIIRATLPYAGRSHIVGITGPAGAGKSSLINILAMKIAQEGRHPAVLAVDPTSHITGGAILGDRVRMSESTDSGVYIRSIASRGATGAVSASLRNGIRILEYAGYDTIIIESVGAGQTEVDISSIVDVTAVVFNPHTGDSIQTIKAGITEIGDVCVINKADLPGSSALYDAVRDFIGDSDRNPEVLLTSVKDNTGMNELAHVLMSMLKEREATRYERRTASLQGEIKDIILNKVQRRIDVIMKEKNVQTLMDAVMSGKMDPYDVASHIGQDIMGDVKES